MLFVKRDSFGVESGVGEGSKRRRGMGIDGMNLRLEAFLMCTLGKALEGIMRHSEPNHYLARNGFVSFTH